MSPTTEKKILDLLRRHHVMTIATVRSDGYPQATTVTYSNDGFTLYFACDKGAQKVRNIRRSAKVSLAIDRDARDWNRIKGLSMGGDASVLRNVREVQHALGLLQAKFPQWGEISLEELETLAFVKVTPKVICLLDYSAGFGHTELVRPRIEPRARGKRSIIKTGKALIARPARKARELG